MNTNATNSHRLVSRVCYLASYSQSVMRIASLLSAIYLLSPSIADAQDLDPDGNQAILGGDWFSDSNWENLTANRFVVGLATTDLTGGSIEITGTGGVFSVSRRGIINQSGGRVRSTNGNGFVSGELNLSGNAEFDLRGRLRIIDGGTLDIRNGALLNLDDFTVGDFAAGGISNSGTTNIADDATVNVFGELVVGERGVTSVLNQTGGLITSGTVRIGEGANASFNQSDGEVEVEGETLVGVTSTGTLNLSGEAVYRSNLDLFALGANVGVTGNLAIAGNAQLVADEVQIGNDGVGDARLSGNARVMAGTTFIAARANGTEFSEGLLELRENAEYRGGDIFVGNAGSGNLILAGNSLLVAGDDVLVGRADSSTGAIQVLDSARLEVADFLGLASNNAANSAILVVDEGEVTVGGNASAGNIQGQATVMIGQSGFGGKVSIAGNASFGGSRSITELTIDSGELQANNALFDGFDPDNTSNTLNLNGGLLRGLENIEFQRGVVANIAGGILLTGADLVLGNDPTNDLNAVVVTQTGGEVNVGNDFLLREANRARYVLEEGKVNVDRDAVLVLCQN